MRFNLCWYQRPGNKPGLRSLGWDCCRESEAPGRERRVRRVRTRSLSHYQREETRQMSVMGTIKMKSEMIPPPTTACIGALYHKLLWTLSEECLLFVSELQMSGVDNVTRHMSHDTRGNLSRGKTSGWQSVKITLKQWLKNHHKTDTWCNQQPVAVASTFPWTFVKLPQQALSSLWSKCWEIKIRDKWLLAKLMFCPIS